MRVLLGMLIGLCFTGAAFAAEPEPKNPKDIKPLQQHVKLMVRVCLEEHPDVCEKREIVNSDAAVEMEPLNMFACSGYQAQTSLIDYIEHHRSQLKGYIFGGFVCEFGNRMPPDRERKS